MKTRLSPLILGALAALGVSGAAPVSSGSAQPAADRPAVGQIYVVAPHEVNRREVGRTAYGAPIEEVTLTHRVGYADLDLTKQADVDVLTMRVKNAAMTACKELDKLYPERDYAPAVQMPRTCFRAAMDGAMPQVVEAVENAHR